MNICFAYPGHLHARSGGGLATYLRHTVKMLIRGGHRVWCLCEPFEAREPHELAAIYYPVETPGRWRSMPDFKAVQRIARCFERQWGIARALRQIERNQALDVVEYNNAYADSLWHGFFSKTPRLVRVHSPYEQVGFIRGMEKWCFRHADLVVGPSRYAVEYAQREIGGAKTRTVYGPNPFSPEEPALKKSVERHKTVLFSGWMTFRKGFDVLLKAMEAVMAEIPESRLAVVGGESTFGNVVRADFMKTIEEKNWLGRVVFHGLVSDPAELSGLYRTSAVCVIPSREEALSYVCLEAMASGTPVVAAKAGGLGELVTEDTGFVVSPGDACALKNAIVNVMRHPEEASARALRAKSTVSRYFSEASSAAAIELYETVSTRKFAQGIQR